MAISKLWSIVDTQSIEEVYPCAIIKDDILYTVMWQNKRIGTCNQCNGRHDSNYGE